MIILDATTKSIEILLDSVITTNQLPVVASFADHSSTSLTPGSNDTQTNSTTPVTIVAAPGASTQRQVKHISIYNADTASTIVTVRFNNNSTLRTMVKVTLLPGETLMFSERLGWGIVVTESADDLITRIAGDSGAAGLDITLQRLTSDSSDITSATPTTVMTTTSIVPGVWHFRYTVIYQSAAIGTGISFVVNHTGTLSEYVKTWHHITTGGAADTGVGDDIAGDNTGQMVEGHSNTVNNADEGPTAGVATANADIMAVVEGFIIVTVSGSLELKIRTESAGTAVRLKAGSFLFLTKVS